MLNYLGFLLYVISTNSFFLLLQIIAPINKRAKLYVNGRKNIFRHIAQSIQGDSRTAIWFHVSSLGEFEQVRPVIEELRILKPSHKYIITIFSPSGYEIRKNDSVADFIFYLPNDSKSNAKKLVNFIKPEMVFWVKYDFWFFYLNELKKQNISTYLIDASFNSKQVYFKWYAVFYKKILENFTYIFTQNEKSKLLLEDINILNVVNTGDTRFDRVYHEKKQTESFDLIEHFKGEHLLIVLGSSYELEEQMMANYFNENVKIIIAPHFVNNENIEANIGMLSKIYKYADISFIGGGFEPKGLHNILEAAIYENVIIFGNEIDYFPEAINFLENNAAISVKNQSEFDFNMNNLLTNKTLRQILGSNAKRQIMNNVGASKKIIDYISKA
jgi:3-deoxy-D-manno-octulosonic-acid transferase